VVLPQGIRQKVSIDLTFGWVFCIVIAAVGWWFVISLLLDDTVPKSHLFSLKLGVALIESARLGIWRNDGWKRDVVATTQLSPFFRLDNLSNDWIHKLVIADWQASTPSNTKKSGMGLYVRLGCYYLNAG